jgi:hypothetical protein
VEGSALDPVAEETLRTVMVAGASAAQADDETLETWTRALGFWACPPR